MSVQGLRRGLILGVVASKAVGDVLYCASDVFNALGNLASSLDCSVSFLEADFARRYRDLTGIDLAAMANVHGRYDEKPARVDEDAE